LCLLAWTLQIRAAEAHVKWFCPFDITETPRALRSVVDGTLLYLVAVSLGIFLVASIVNNSLLGRGMVWSLDRTTTPLRPHIVPMMRATYAAFFISLWAVGGIILTPELTTKVAAISWLQLAIAAGFMWRRTLILSSLGIVFLYGYAVSQYGTYHLLDYPIFLGAAGFFAVSSLTKWPGEVHPLDIVRWAAAITLMWASVEKWGYPQWTYPLFVTHPEMSMGFDVNFYMTAAGVVEFSLAFALIGPPLMRRTAAVILASMFITAIFGFGKIDAIGHAPIIIVMIAIATDARPTRRVAPLLMPTAYIFALLIVIAAYYVGHAVLVGTRA
jgi:hypothetical protein